MTFLGLGMALQADIEFIELLRPVIESDCDFFEVTTETLWTTDDGRITPNAFHPVFQEIQQRSGKAFVAHGLNYSPGTALNDHKEQEISNLWIEQYLQDQATFGYEWISEHLGYTRSRGLNHSLPLPLPPTLQSMRVIAEKMKQLREVNPLIALETSVQPYLLGGTEEWVSFLHGVCQQTPCALILDLHNLYTDAQNFGFDPFDVLGQIDGRLVLEIHVSGGSLSEPEWVSSGRQFRLDSHDGAIPLPVLELLKVALNQCPNLRGVVWERLNGTFTANDVPSLRSEFALVREIVNSRAPAVTDEARVFPSQVPDEPESGQLGALIAETLCGGLRGRDIDQQRLQGIGLESRLRLSGCQPDALEMAALIMAKLRMERLSSGHRGFHDMMRQAPADASSVFQQYMRAIPPAALWPEDEAAQFDSWQAESTR